MVKVVVIAMVQVVAVVVAMVVAVSAYARGNYRLSSTAYIRDGDESGSDKVGGIVDF